VPSHTPPQTVPSVEHASREPLGEPVTGVQMPPPFGRLHASHWPVQDERQQTPSAQKLEAHSEPLLHGSPGSFWPTQTPATQF
jgi:hypothetical protein